MVGRIPGPICFMTDAGIDEGTLSRTRMPTPETSGTYTLTPVKSKRQLTDTEKKLVADVKNALQEGLAPIIPIKSGAYWVTWVENNAKNSRKMSELNTAFKANAEAFIKALEDAGATVKIRNTKRSAKSAYLFHWSWKIALGKCKASDTEKMAGVDIEWNHGDDEKSKSAALEMVTGFGLAVPPQSTDAPSLTSNHIAGKAIDMDITWTGTIKVKKKDNTEVSVIYMANVNANTVLHTIGASYNVIKRTTDAPHWSVNGG